MMKFLVKAYIGLAIMQFIGGALLYAWLSYWAGHVLSIADLLTTIQ